MFNDSMQKYKKNNLSLIYTRVLFTAILLFLFTITAIPTKSMGVQRSFGSTFYFMKEGKPSFLIENQRLEYPSKQYDNSNQKKIKSKNSLLSLKKTEKKLAKKEKPTRKFHKFLIFAFISLFLAMVSMFVVFAPYISFLAKFIFTILYYISSFSISIFSFLAFRKAKKNPELWRGRILAHILFLLSLYQSIILFLSLFRVFTYIFYGMG